MLTLIQSCRPLAARSCKAGAQLSFEVANAPGARCQKCQKPQSRRSRPSGSDEPVAPRRRRLAP